MLHVFPREIIVTKCCLMGIGVGDMRRAVLIAIWHPHFQKVVPQNRFSQKTLNRVFQKTPMSCPQEIVQRVRNSWKTYLRVSEKTYSTVQPSPYSVHRFGARIYLVLYRPNCSITKCIQAFQRHVHQGETGFETQ